MTTADVMIAAAVLVLLVLAWRGMRRHHTAGGCGGDCRHCAGGCDARRRQP